jgi:hypothetical protein
MKGAGWGAAIVFCLAFLLPGWGFAARPLFTEDAETLEKGSAKIEMGFDHARGNSGDKFNASSLQVAYGLSDKCHNIGYPALKVKSFKTSVTQNQVSVHFSMGMRYSNV